MKRLVPQGEDEGGAPNEEVSTTGGEYRWNSS